MGKITKKMTTFLSRLAIMGLVVQLIGCNTKMDTEQMVDELYGKMSQEERIAQLKSMYMDELFNEQGQLDTAKCHELIPYGIGHFSQFCLQQPRDPNELRDRAAAVQDWLKHHTPNGIPALMHEEVLSGVNTLGGTHPCKQVCRQKYHRREVKLTGKKNQQEEADWSPLHKGVKGKHENRHGDALLQGGKMEDKQQQTKVI